MKPHLRNWRQIYIQVLLTALVTAAVSGVALIYKNIYIDQNKLERNIAEVQQLAEVLAPVVDGFDLISVKAIGESLTASSFIHEVRIEGRLDYVMFRSTPAPEGDGVSYLDVKAPIELVGIDGRRDLVGNLFVKLATPRMTPIYIDALLSAALIFVVTALISALTTLIYVQKTIARPLQRLQVAIEQTLTQGQPVEAEETGAGFVGTFQRQFNRMQVALLHSQMALQEKSEDLETNSNLIREMLSSVRQSVRLYKADGRRDFGELQVSFVLPRDPLRTVDEFRAYLDDDARAPPRELRPASTAEPSSDAIMFDVDVFTADQRWFNVKCVALPESSSALLVTDITVSKEMEHSLQYAQRMEVIAVLTSGIAHDFNNVLAIISGNLELIKVRAGDASDISRYSDQGLNACRRAATLVTSLLAFSKQKPKQLKSTPVADILEEVAVMAQVTIGSNIEMKVQCDVSANVHLDAVMLETSLLNLIMNARDAMPDGGTIALKALPPTQDEVAANGLDPDRPHIRLSVVDQGVGVLEHLTGEISKPFFTTKPHGTGLGLSMVDNFATDAGGRLVFARNQTVGMTFSIILPCTFEAEAEVEAAAPLAALPADEAGRDVLVMLVEDEQALRSVMTEIFRLSGFDCVALGSVQEVRRYLAGSGAPPDILVSDLNLPDGTAHDLLGEDFAALRGLPKILMSGNMETAKGVVSQDGFDEVCLKPVRSSTLIAMIDRLIADHDERRRKLSERPAPPGRDGASSFSASASTRKI